MDAKVKESLWLEIIEHSRYPYLTFEKIFSKEGEASSFKKLGTGEYEVILQNKDGEEWFALVEHQTYGLPVKRLRGYERAGRVSIARFDGTALFDD